MPFNGIGPMELVIVLVIALLVLGPKRLPEVGRSIGNGMREFKDSISGAAATTRTTTDPTGVQGGQVAASRQGAARRGRIRRTRDDG